MADSTAVREVIRSDAAALLASVGVSRVVVVDDQYAADVEELIGICSAMVGRDEFKFRHLSNVDFHSPHEVWSGSVRDVWKSLDNGSRRTLLAEARAVESETGGRTADEDFSDSQEMGDFRAATCLQEILGELSDCEFIPLSLGEWRARSEELLGDEQAGSMLLLFDRDFSREEDGTAEEGIRLLQRAQSRNVDYYGLISHTFSVGGEYIAWKNLSEEYGLNGDRFVVIAKERLNSESPDHYGFLGMLRLAALSGRYASVKSIAWTIFEESLEEAKRTVDRLSVLDFDRIVFESSRRAGIWEPATLSRLFGILMRREAQKRLREDGTLFEAIIAARRVSAVSENIADAIGREEISNEAVRIQRFEIYDSGEELNESHAPLELGDVFEVVSSGKRYILLVQPCDLMVRKDGLRSYDEKLGRIGTLVELAVDEETQRDRWGKLPFYEHQTGKPAFAKFANAHQVRLAVLDLCVIGANGMAAIEVGGEYPELLIDPWRKRHQRLQKLFRTALDRYKQLKEKQVGKELEMLALPRMSTTVSVSAAVNGNRVEYGIKRVLRLRHPWSAALFTAFAQHLARAAFEHPFEHRVEFPGEAH